jgi:hypothetical protein
VSKKTIKLSLQGTKQFKKHSKVFNQSLIPSQFDITKILCNNRYRNPKHYQVFLTIIITIKHYYYMAKELYTSHEDSKPETLGQKLESHQKDLDKFNDIILCLKEKQLLESLSEENVKNLELSLAAYEALAFGSAELIRVIEWQIKKSTVNPELESDLGNPRE